MSNTEMVSVPRELLHKAVNGHRSEHSVAIRDLRELLAQPAEQHQGELVGYVCPRALDAAVNGRIGAEQISILKTPYLYINKPIYTHPAPADPGEVEQLREGRKLLLDDLDRRDSTVAALRAQLAERDALITRVVHSGALTCPDYSELEAECCALSASAEPSAPVERDELPGFAKTVIVKLIRLRDCAEDGQDADIGRNWFDTLVQLGLLHRVQRSPARWEITCEGDALIEARAALERKP